MEYKKMTVEELMEEHFRLRTLEHRELCMHGHRCPSMDSNGDCSDLIHKRFKLFLDKIENELNTRPEYHELMEGQGNDTFDDDLPF